MNDFINSAWQSMSMIQSLMPDAIGTEIIEISDGRHHEVIIIQVTINHHICNEILPFFNL